MKRIFYSGPR